MIYYIDKSCVDALDTGNDDCIACFESLALSRRHGENMLLAERRVLDFLSKSEKLSDVSRGVYRRLLAKASEFKLILKSVERYCRIMGNAETSIETEDGKTVVYISAAEMGKRDMHKLSIILAENVDDIKFYKIIGKHYTAKYNIGNIKIDFADRLGGGSTTSGILESIIAEEKNMCLCISDSDKKYPGDSAGDTLKKIMKTAEDNKEKKYFWDVIPLEVHEIENLIPVNVLEEIQREKGVVMEGIGFVKFLYGKSVEGDSPYVYYDFKNGIKLKRFFLHKSADEQEKKKFDRLEPYRQYWRGYIEEYGITIEDNKQDALAGGICEKILIHTLDFLNGMTGEELLKKCRVGGMLEKYWDDIGSRILSWGCVGERFAA